MSKHYYAVLFPRNFGNEYEVYKFASQQDRDDYTDTAVVKQGAKWEYVTAREASSYIYAQDYYSKRLFEILKCDYDGDDFRWKRREFMSADW